MSDLESRVAGTNGQHSIYERGRYLATVNDRETADRIIAALAARATDRAEVERLQAQLESVATSLRKYGDHVSIRGSRCGPTFGCVCGFDAAMDAALAAAPAERTEGR